LELVLFLEIKLDRVIIKLQKVFIDYRLQKEVKIKKAENLILGHIFTELIILIQEVIFLELGYMEQVPHF
jgi:hypothetical protein